MPVHNILGDAEEPQRRITQDVVEVPHQVTGVDLSRRITQDVVEVPHQVFGADLSRRFTQIVVEVLVTQPVHPFGDQPFPEHPMWSPAYIQDPIESKEQVYASFFGIHNKEIVIGERGGRIKFTRR